MLAPARAPAELPPHYYRENFNRLLDTVDAQYADLLTAQETGFLATYRGLGFDAQCLYVRLVSRVGPWFREGALDYPELGPLAPALDQLLRCGLAIRPDALTLADLGQLCTVAELSKWFGQPLADKATLLQSIGDSGDCSENGLGVIEAADKARVIAPCHKEVVALFQLLFFGNRRQGMTDFVLSDLGLFRYFPYPLDRSQRLFPDRLVLQEYLACAEQDDQWFALLEANDRDGMRELAESLLQSAPGHVSIRKRWCRLYNRVARQMERQDECHLALSLYRKSNQHPARERTARLLERAADYTQAEVLCLAIQAEPWCEDEADAAARILPRVQRKLHGTRSPRRRDNFDELIFALPQEPGRVEMQVAVALADQWDQVLYVENQLMNALFGLAFWEQIFAPLPGAFNNPYQNAPADMYEQHFLAPRKAAIDDRIAQLSGLELARELGDCWLRYQGFQCRWINWRRVSHERVVAAASIIPKQHLMALWRRMLFDPRENRRGFPDLLALGTSPGDYAMIEVKGPGDTLQDNQKRWLRFFKRVGIPAAVAHVTWTDE